MAYEGCTGQPPSSGARVVDLATACEWPQNLRGEDNNLARAALLEGAISLVERSVRSRTITAAGTHCRAPPSQSPPTTTTSSAQCEGGPSLFLSHHTVLYLSLSHSLSAPLPFPLLLS